MGWSGVEWGWVRQSWLDRVGLGLVGIGWIDEDVRKEIEGTYTHTAVTQYDDDEEDLITILIRKQR